MKKVLSVIMAAAAVFTMGTAVFADTGKSDTNGTATISFDTEKSLDYIHTFGNASDSGLALEITEDDALGGKCLKLTESFKGTLSNRYGGFYLEASDFGIDNFSGYTMSVYINASSKASKAVGQLEVFSDGAGWQSVNFLTSSPGEYRTASITVPANVANTKLLVLHLMLTLLLLQMLTFLTLRMVQIFPSASSPLCPLLTAVSQHP